MEEKKSYKYLDIITVAFVVVLLISNLVGSVKITRLCLSDDLCTSFTTGIFLFPAAYLAGDLLTEIYGYARSRRVIWTGFAALIITNLIIQFFSWLPADPNWGLQESYDQIFNFTFRVSIASMIAYFCGEFTNSFVIAKLKILTKGKFQALRIIGSTAAGELVDTVIILFLGFYGAPGFPLEVIMAALFSNYIAKVLWEIIVYPIFTVHIIKWLKKAENEDYYDYETNLSPFHA